MTCPQGKVRRQAGCSSSVRCSSCSARCATAAAAVADDAATLTRPPSRASRCTTCGDVGVGLCLAACRRRRFMRSVTRTWRRRRGCCGVSAESNPLELLSRRTSQPSAGVLNPDLEQPEHCGDMEGAAAYTPTSRSISAPVSFMLHPVMSLPTDMQPGVARWDMEESSPAGSPHKAGSAGGTFSVLPIARVESVRDAQRGESAGSPQKAGTSGGTFSVLPIARVESVRDAQRGGDMEESASAGSPHKAAGCGAAFSVLPIERVESVRDAQRGESGSPPKAAGCGATFSVPPIERVESVRDAQRGGDMEEPAPATEPPSPAAQGSGDAVGAAILQPCAHPLGGQQYSSLHFD
eukprot:TRINITY_DN1593_c0_g2_i3.p2 TRINITY_DN1593_c0_g2~~TRINITY_DN1593_c0_g2_i3.p2  ORF type:complete len:351 (+),score=43.16 TRINITY_DN1593_c0_g2_i3:237-1289(+)